MASHQAHSEGVVVTVPDIGIRAADFEAFSDALAKVRETTALAIERPTCFLCYTDRGHPFHDDGDVNDAFDIEDLVTG